MAYCAADTDHSNGCCAGFAPDFPFHPGVNPGHLVCVFNCHRNYTAYRLENQRGILIPGTFASIIQRKG